jgi:hypothetical protein
VHGFPLGSVKGSACGDCEYAIGKQNKTYNKRVYSNLPVASPDYKRVTHEAYIAPPAEGTLWMMAATLRSRSAKPDFYCIPGSCFAPRVKKAKVAPGDKKKKAVENTRSAFLGLSTFDYGDMEGTAQTACSFGSLHTV